MLQGFIKRVKKEPIFNPFNEGVMVTNKDLYIALHADLSCERGFLFISMGERRW
jgi:hypothetical protein